MKLVEVILNILLCQLNAIQLFICRSNSMIFFNEGLPRLSQMCYTEAHLHGFKCSCNILSINPNGVITYLSQAMCNSLMQDSFDVCPTRMV